MNGDRSRHTEQMAAQPRFHIHGAGLLALSAAVVVVTFATGFALGYGSRTGPDATTLARTVCDFATFPPYPGALMLKGSTGAGVAYQVYGATYARVVRFYQQGAGQESWSFTQSSPRGTFVDTFAVLGPDGCRGMVTIEMDSGGATRIAANPS